MSQAGELNASGGGGSGVTSLAGDSGGPLTGALTLTGGTSGAFFSGSGTTITESFNFLALPNTDNSGNGIITLNSVSYFSNFGTNNIFAGPNSGNVTNSGAGNVGLGFDVLNSLSTGNDNIAIGASSLAALTTGSNNTSVGSLALQANVTGSFNVSIGANSLSGSTAGDSNVAIGPSALSGLLTGTNNTSVGANSGSNYVGAEDSNIVIGNAGVVADANTIRIGTTGSGTGQQNKCFVAGVAGVSVSNLNTVTIDTTTGQLGSTAASGFVSSWTDVTSTSQAIAVNNGYTANNVGLVTLTLPATAAYGSVMAVVGKGAGGWKIAQNSGQTIHFGASNTTSGAGGSLASTKQYDTVFVLCTVANTDFTVYSSIGNLTVV